MSQLVLLGKNNISKFAKNCVIGPDPRQTTYLVHVVELDPMHNGFLGRQKEIFLVSDRRQETI